MGKTVLHLSTGHGGNFVVFNKSYLLVWHITLVSDQDLVDTLAGMLLNVGEPVANVYQEKYEIIRGQSTRFCSILSFLA